MKFRVEKASDYNYESEIEISDFNELIEFINTEGKGCVVIDLTVEDRIISEPTITIYDDYIE